MDLMSKIKSAGFTLAQLGERCGVEGQNPGRTVQRYLTGEREAPTEFKQAVIESTDHTVSITDFHNARLAWLRLHRPEKFPEPAE